MNINNFLDEVIKENQKEEEIIEQNSQENNPVYKELPISEIKNVCEFKEALQIIESNNFEIINYKQFQKTEEFWYIETVEKYLCKYNNWQFEICVMSDVDIEEGIFGVYNVKNLLNDEVFEMYLDLGCRNTSKLKFQWFKTLLDKQSIKEFIDCIFSRFYSIPSLFEKAGYSVDSSKFYFEDFFSKKCTPLTIKKDETTLYLSIYCGFFEDDFFVCVSNKENWSYNDCSSIYDNKYVEFVKYIDEASFKELEEKAESIISDIKGLTGFKYNEEVFNNLKLYNYFKSLAHKVNYYDDFNHYFIKFEIPTFLGRDDVNESFKTSKFSGKELYGLITTSFNDAAQWSVGNTAVNVTFEVIYDKKIDKDNIILKTYVYKSNNQTNEIVFESDEMKNLYEEDECYLMLFKYAKKDFIDEKKFDNPDKLKKYINDYLQNISDKFGYKADFNNPKNLW